MNLKIKTEQAAGICGQQQDRVLETQAHDCTLLVTADGHGPRGHKAADDALTTFSAWIRANLPPAEVRTVPATCKQLQAAIEVSQAWVVDPYSGCSLGAVLIDWQRNLLYALQIGSVRIMLIDTDGQRMTYSGHGLEDSEEARAQVVRQGAKLGKVSDKLYAFDRTGQWGLDLSHSIGDRVLDGYLGREADIYVWDLRTLEAGALYSRGLYSGTLQPKQARKALQNSFYEREAFSPNKVWAPLLPRLQNPEQDFALNTSLQRFRIIR